MTKTLQEQPLEGKKRTTKGKIFECLAAVLFSIESQQKGAKSLFVFNVIFV